MTTASKSQQAAQRRIEQIEADLFERIQKIEGYDSPCANFDKLALYFENEQLKEVGRLVKQHSLPRLALENFRKKMATVIFDAAGKWECYSQQAKFGKKHSI